MIQQEHVSLLALEIRRFNKKRFQPSISRFQLCSKYDTSGKTIGFRFAAIVLPPPSLQDQQGQMPDRPASIKQTRSAKGLSCGKCQLFHGAQLRVGSGTPSAQIASVLAGKSRSQSSRGGKLPQIRSGKSISNFWKM
jgi:hypothetical protein